MKHPIFSIAQFSFAYPEQERPVLNNITLDISSGSFVTLCGPSGCGKTTLLRQLKPILAPHGQRQGHILFEGQPLDTLYQRTQSERIGFVLQSPEQQIVTDKVWHELAFGLESLGYDSERIRLRVAEMASFFGIQEWFHKDVRTLSGGQKQLLNLASVMAMQPSVLLLDEPTSQLDPIAASEFLAVLGKLNRDLGVTVILTEHRLEEALPLSHRALVLDEGRLIADAPPQELGGQLRDLGHRMFAAMPAPLRIWAAVPNHFPSPLTVQEGRDWLTHFATQSPLTDCPLPPALAPITAPILELHEVWFRYEKTAPDVVKGASLRLPQGALFALVGGNGAGKSTTLSLLSGLLKPQRGEVLLDGKALSKIPSAMRYEGLLGVLPQNPQALFVAPTLEEDLQEILRDRPLSVDERTARLQAVTKLCHLGHLLRAHPYDLSGGEQQRAALAKVLLLKPRILLLDEPTKGLDAAFKETLAGILQQLRAQGASILMVSHDVEFCARYATHCALFFDGNVLSQDEPKRFFAGNSFYTTAASRMSRHLLPHAVTTEDVITACSGTVVAASPPPTVPVPPMCGAAAPTRPHRTAALPLWRKALGGSLLTACLLLLVILIRGMPQSLGGDILSLGFSALSAEATSLFLLLGLVLCALSGAMLFTRKRAPRAHVALAAAAPRGRLSKRTILAAALILVLIPLTLWLGTTYLGDRKYYFISLLIVLETLLPFALIFEGRKPQARELVLIASLCAITVAGRAAFFFLPQFKPVAALVILAGIALGGESGFLVGAASMLCSNLFFGQGPWTPFQMFAMGIIGFLAGVLFRKGLWERARAAYCVYGGLAVFFIYGILMNSYTLLQTQQNVSFSMILTACLVALPMDLIHALSTAFFLWVAGPAMLEKLDRIKLKYGLVEQRSGD